MKVFCYDWWTKKNCREYWEQRKIVNDDYTHWSAPYWMVNRYRILPINSDMVTPIPCDVFPTCTSSWPPLHRQHPASFPSLKGNSCLLGAIECIGERYWKIFGKDDPPPLWSCSSWRDSTGNHPRKPCDHSFFMPLNHQALPNEWPPWTYGQKEFLKVPCAWIFFWRSHVCSTRRLF